ncbi:ECF RNA polymerase sigma factor SigK [Streptomyces sp. NPDC058572]|uniref:ECF RNA polymerase sigma factor SigK n=1 Tax=Streptomyces sp. NPDC058572 TaxID=3346546 RepID=UPI003646FEF5
MEREDSGRGPRHPTDGRLDELMQQVAAGDQDAFVPVYDALHARVMGLVFRILKDAAQAEEVTQDVLVEVWRKAGRFRPERGSAVTWVMTLAHRRAVDRVRHAQARSDREHRAALLERGTPFDEVAEEVEARQDREEVHRCLETLSDLQRQALTLAFYEGMTYLDVARTLSLPPGTVKSRLRDGLHRLRDCLEATR